MSHRIQIAPEDILHMIKDIKASLRDEVRAEIQKELEEQIRREYENSPVRRGILGKLSGLIGLMPDSTGKPSGSWTVYLLAHLPILLVTICWCLSLFFGTGAKNLVVISPWIVLSPLFLSWISWLAHHKKVAEVAVSILTAIGDAFRGLKGGSSIGTSSTVINTVSSAVGGGSVASPTDPSLTPGASVPIRIKNEASPAKTNPESIPESPTVSP